MLLGVWAWLGVLGVLGTVPGATAAQSRVEPAAHRMQTTDLPAWVLGVDPAALPPNLPMAALLDASGLLTIDQVEQQTASFVPVNRSKPYAIGNGALWLRFNAVVDDPAAHWRLTVPLATVDDVKLYFRNHKGQWVTQVGGDTRPMSSWAQRGLYPAFSMAHESGATVSYYLQVRHTRIPFSALPHVVSTAELMTTRQSEHIWLGIYFGLAMLVVTLALSNALAYSDWGFGAYAVYVALLAGAQGVTTGVAGLYWWPEAPELNNTLAIVMLASAASAALWFVRTVTVPRRFSAALDAVALAWMGALPVAGVLNAALPGVFSFALYNLLISLALALLLLLLAAALADGARHARWVSLGFLPVVMAAVLPIMRDLGWVRTQFFTEYGLMLGSAAAVPILFYGLNRRVAPHRETSTRATSLRNTDPLTGLSSANALLAKLEQVLGTSRRQRQNFAVLLIDLANLGALQKRHGRETADRALVMAASCIRGVAHPADTVARADDNQFALLMDGPVNLDTANDVATKILASGLRLAHGLPDAEPLLFHIAVGYPKEVRLATPTHPNVVLKSLQETLKDMIQGSRKTIRLVKL